MTTDNRVPAGVPTGGQFATGAKGENGDLPDGPVRYSDDEFEKLSVDESGSACGDASLGQEVSTARRWQTGDPEKPFVMCEKTTFVTASISDDLPGDLDYDDLMRTGGDLDYSDLETIKDDHPEVLPYVSYYVNTMTAWVAYTDRDEPGSSETTSDYVYEEDSEPYSSYESAKSAALRTAEDINWDDYSPDDFGCS